MNRTVLRNMVIVCICITLLCSGCTINTGVQAQQVEATVVYKPEEKLILENTLTPLSTGKLDYITETVTPTPTFVQTPIPESVQSPTATVTLTPTHNTTAPTEVISGSKTNEVYFSDYYKELPKSGYIDKMIIPDTIVIHTDDQSGNYPEIWYAMGTYWGLGDTKSVHFAICRDEILQMLPMSSTDVMQAIGTTPYWDENNILRNYNKRSIQIEMCGRTYNYMITGDASPEMVEAIKATTKTAVELTATLMMFYDIPLKNVVGHYQVGPGKTDPGNLYFEQYFLPLLTEELDRLTQTKY